MQHLGLDQVSPTVELGERKPAQERHGQNHPVSEHQVRERKERRIQNGGTVALRQDRCVAPEE